MKLNIDVELDPGYEGPELDRQVIDAIATKLIHGSFRGSADLEQIRTKAQSEVKRRIAECVDDRIEEICEEVLSEGIAATDDYGRPKGEKKPFHDICKDKIAEKLSNRNYGLQSTLTKVVGKHLAGELNGVVKAKIAELSKAIDADFYERVAVELRKKAGIR